MIHKLKTYLGSLSVSIYLIYFSKFVKTQFSAELNNVFCVIIRHAELLIGILPRCSFVSRPVFFREGGALLFILLTLVVKAILYA